MPRYRRTRSGEDWEPITSVLLLTLSWIAISVVVLLGSSYHDPLGVPTALYTMLRGPILVGFLLLSVMMLVGWWRIITMFNRDL